jgi:hypothetical protein
MICYAKITDTATLVGQLRLNRQALNLLDIGIEAPIGETWARVNGETG